MSSQKPQTVLYSRAAIGILAAAGISYGLSKTGQFSWIQICAIGCGVALLLVVYGYLTQRGYLWYLKKRHPNFTENGVLKLRARIIIGILLVAILTLAIAGGIRSVSQAISLLLLLLVVGISLVLLERFLQK